MRYKITIDNVPHIIDEIYRKFRMYYSVKLNLINLKYWGVKYGKKLNIDGFIKIKRLPSSIIIIGNNCTFLNKQTSNLIGINHKCILSTQTREAKLIIGNNCGFSGTVIGAFKLITIGNYVRCGANTLITDSDWHLEDHRSGKPKEVFIDDNVWLGINTVVLKGVTIGKNSIIGANSVVTKSIPENVIAAGNPCKILKYL